MVVFAVSVGVGILSLVITLGLWYMDSRPVGNQSLIIRCVSPIHLSYLLASCCHTITRQLVIAIAVLPVVLLV